MYVQMSLRSLQMEDLSVEPNHKHRRIVVSSAAIGQEGKTLNNQPPEFCSKSCTNLLNCLPINSNHVSLPEHFETEAGYESFIGTKRRKLAE
jgi:hypothetical protein